MRSCNRYRGVRRGGGFTLVELLVVIGIIAVLIGILIPTLNKARESAVRVKCAANLRQWGQALYAYQTDNRGKLPGVWESGGQPSVLWVDWTVNPSNRFGQALQQRIGEINVPMMAKYIKGFNPRSDYPSQRQQLSGAWICPANGDQSGMEPGWFLPFGPKPFATHIHYAYFYAPSQWAA